MVGIKTVSTNVQSGSKSCSNFATRKSNPLALPSANAWETSADLISSQQHTPRKTEHFLTLTLNSNGCAQHSAGVSGLNEEGTCLCKKHFFPKLF